MRKHTKIKQSRAGGSLVNMANESQQMSFSTNENEGTSQNNQVATRELLSSSANTLIEEINAKRKRDQELLSDFKKAIEQQCSNAYSSVEMAMYNSYENTQSTMEEKLQELFVVLERIEKLEVELAQFKTALSALYSDVHGPDVV